MKKNTLMTKKELVKHLKNLTTEYVENVKMAMSGYWYNDYTNDIDGLIHDLVNKETSLYISKGLAKNK